MENVNVYLRMLNGIMMVSALMPMIKIIEMTSLLNKKNKLKLAVEKVVRIVRRIGAVDVRMDFTY